MGKKGQRDLDLDLDYCDGGRCGDLSYALVCVLEPWDCLS